MNKASLEGDKFIFDATFDDILAQPGIDTAVLEKLLQSGTPNFVCGDPEIIKINNQVDIVYRYRLVSQPKVITSIIPKTQCATQYRHALRSSDIREMRIDAAIAAVETISKELPSKIGDYLTLDRISFNRPTRTMHRYLTLSDPQLATQSIDAIREHYQQIESNGMCEHGISANSNRYYNVEEHFTLADRGATFKVIIHQGFCASR
ncbi:MULTISPECIES: hypothetical protein [Eikenella]|uniref:hypothetical protein n=1 Tax=Eikenella TaxID=538 RepID=UPI000A425719|nr:MULTISPECIES: hypothetical protein [Eikenella]